METTGNEAPPSSAEPEVLNRDDAVRLQIITGEATKARLALCRRDLDSFIEYVGVDSDEPRRPMRQERFHVEMNWMIDTYRKVVAITHPRTGKTTQGALRIVHGLGQDPNRTYGIGGNSDGEAAKVLGVVREYIGDGDAPEREAQQKVREVFPELRPGKKWGGGEIEVRRGIISRDPSVQVFGQNTAPHGARFDGVLLDDVDDFKTTRTAMERSKARKWITSSVFDRFKRDTWCLFNCNAWHPMDLGHTLVKEHGFRLFRRPIFLDAAERNVSWSKLWSREAIEQARVTLGPLEFARKFKCQPRDESSIVFPPELIRSAFLAGHGYTLVPGLPTVPAGCCVVTGVDLAVSKRQMVAKREAARTVMLTVLFHPDETRQVVGCESGRWGAEEILRRLADVHRRFGGLVCVENNAAQQYIVDLAGNVPVVPFTTGDNKTDPRFGVESIAVEMSRRMWLLPSGSYAGTPPVPDDPEMQLLAADMEQYTPLGHTGDHLMALWFARELGRRIMAGWRPASFGGTEVRVFGATNGHAA